MRTVQNVLFAGRTCVFTAEHDTQPTVLYRATKWMTYWPLTSVRCWPQWTSSVPGALRPSELLIGRRPLSSSGSCALLGSLAAGGGALPTSCGGWVTVLLLALSEAARLGILLLQAATTPSKAPANVTSATWTWMKMRHLVRMTTSKTCLQHWRYMSFWRCSVSWSCMRVLIY